MIILALIVIAFILLKSSDHKTGPRGGPTVGFCNDGMRGHERRVAEFYGDDLDELEERFAMEDRRSKALEGMVDGETREFEGVKYTSQSLKSFLGELNDK